MKKIIIPKLNGFVYVESYDGRKNEEEERAKIFDENKNYLDYICIDCMSKESYKNILKEIVNCKDIEEFLNNFCPRYDYSESLPYLLMSIFDDCDEDTLEELENDIVKLNEKQLVEKYMINRVGDYYFYLGDY